MTDAFDSELYFLIAKFLKERFPQIGDLFIKECEQNKLFPSRIFIKNPSFKTLDSKILTGIPNDQLVRLIRSACPKSQFPSLFFHESVNETGTNTENSGIKEADVISYNLGLPVNELHNIYAYQRIIGHFDKCYCICIDMTSHVLITGADDGIIKIWKVPEMKLIKSFPRIHYKEISEIVVHPSNKYFASCSLDGTINIFSLTKGTLLKSFDMNVQVHSLRFSPCGRYLACACDNGIVQIFNIHAESDEFSEYYHISIKKDCSWLSFSPCGQLLAISADNGMLCILQIYMRQIVILNGHSDNISVDFVHFAHTKATTLISLATKEKGLKSWTCNGSLWGKVANFSTRTQAGRSTKSKLVSCTFNCDDSKVIGISHMNIFVWDANTHKQTNIMQMPFYTEHCSCLAANPMYPTIIYVGTNDGYSSIWDIQTGEVLSYFRVREGGRINDAVWSRDGTIVYCVDEYGGITEAKTCNSTTCPSTQMFFPCELYDEVPTKDNTRMVVDAEGIALEPQPKIWKLQEMKLECFISRRTKEQEDAEKQIKFMWQKIGSIPFSDYTEIHVIEEEDEEDRNETTDDENGQRTIYSFEEIPVKINIQRHQNSSSRILTRKSRSNNISSPNKNSTKNSSNEDYQESSSLYTTQNIDYLSDDINSQSQYIPPSESSQSDYYTSKQKKTKTRKSKVIYESDSDVSSPVQTRKTKQNQKKQTQKDRPKQKTQHETSERKTKNTNYKSKFTDESDDSVEIKPKSKKTKKKELTDSDGDYQPTQILKSESEYSDSNYNENNAFEESDTSSDYYDEKIPKQKNQRSKKKISSSYSSTSSSSSESDEYKPQRSTRKRKKANQSTRKTKTYVNSESSSYSEAQSSDTFTNSSSDSTSSLEESD